MMAFFPDKPADSDEIRLGAKQIRDNLNGIINDGIVIAKPPLYGDGIPSANLGQIGECYIDTKTGNQYLKNASGIWELKLSLAIKADKSVVDMLSNTVTGKADLVAFNSLLDLSGAKYQTLGSKYGTVTIDAVNGNIAIMTASGTLTMNLVASTILSAMNCRVLTLIMLQGGSYTVTWPTSVKWHGGTAPTLTTGTDVLTFMTVNNGGTWYGALFGSYS